MDPQLVQTSGGNGFGQVAEGFQPLGLEGDATVRGRELTSSLLEARDPGACESPRAPAGCAPPNRREARPPCGPRAAGGEPLPPWVLSFPRRDAAESLRCRRERLVNPGAIGGGGGIL